MQRGFNKYILSFVELWGMLLPPFYLHAEYLWAPKFIHCSSNLKWDGT